MSRSKKTESRIAAAEEVLRTGGGRAAAAGAAGVSRHTLSEWCRSDRDVARRLDDAQHEGDAYLVDDQESRLLDEINNGTPSTKWVDGVPHDVRVFDVKQTARFKFLASRDPRYRGGGSLSVRSGTDFDRLLDELDHGEVVDVKEIADAGEVLAISDGKSGALEKMMRRLDEDVDG